MESRPYLKMWKDYDTIILLLSYKMYKAQYCRSQNLLKNSGYKRTRVAVGCDAYAQLYYIMSSTPSSIP